MKKIGILGSGDVAKSLANGCLKYGYQVKLGTSNPEKLTEWKSKAGANGSIGSFNDAALFGEIIILAVKGSAALDILGKLNPDSISGKTVIDTTNPIADTPPQNGVLKFFTNFEESLMERLQKAHPSVNFVKAFSCVGNSFMVNPNFPGGKPTMFICGNNSKSKDEVKVILDLFGWETEDMGLVESAKAIEPLCILWCLPGLLNNKWNHAFKLLKT